jgi:hypothetical protein
VKRSNRVATHMQTAVNAITKHRYTTRHQKQAEEDANSAAISAALQEDDGEGEDGAGAGAGAGSQSRRTVSSTGKSKLGYLQMIMVAMEALQVRRSARLHCRLSVAGPSTPSHRFPCPSVIKWCSQSRAQMCRVRS